MVHTNIAANPAATQDGDAEVHKENAANPDTWVGRLPWERGEHDYPMTWGPHRASRTAGAVVADSVAVTSTTSCVHGSTSSAATHTMISPIAATPPTSPAAPLTTSSTMCPAMFAVAFPTSASTAAQDGQQCSSKCVVNTPVGCSGGTGPTAAPPCDGGNDNSKNTQGQPSRQPQCL